MEEGRIMSVKFVCDKLRESLVLVAYKSKSVHFPVFFERFEYNLNEEKLIMFDEQNEYNELTLLVESIENVTIDDENNEIQIYINLKGGEKIYLNKTK